MINSKHINPYNYKLRANKVEYSTAAGPYKTTNDAKVSFIISDFYRIKNTTHRLKINNTKGHASIGYAMIIGHELIVQFGLKANFGRQNTIMGQDCNTYGGSSKFYRPP